MPIRPYFETENCVLYNCDCIDGMGALPSPTNVSCIVTSPPYNIGKAYESVAPVDDYVSWSSKWIEASTKLLGPRGSMWLNVGYSSHPNGKCLPLSYLLWDKVPLYFMQEVVWHYKAGVACKKYFSPRNEKLLWYVKHPKDYTFHLDAIRDPHDQSTCTCGTRNGVKRCNPNGKNPTNVWTITRVTAGKNRSSKERTAHPAQFPEQLVEKCILASTDKGDVVLDPFMGSGTTAVVALKHGRKVIGFETNQAYCDIAKERILRSL